MSTLAHKKCQDSRTYPWHNLLQMPNDYPTLSTRDSGGLVGENEDNEHPEHWCSRAEPVLCATPLHGLPPKPEPTCPPAFV